MADSKSASVFPKEDEDRYAGSRRALAAAARFIPTAVTSAARRSVLPHPIVVARASDHMVWDVDGNEFIDYVMGYGPLLLGHSPRAVIAAVQQQLQQGILFGAPHTLELEVARRVVEAVPGAESAIFSNTGSEAVHAAVRLARAVTGRYLIIKFEGHYHGWLDEIGYSLPGQPPQPQGHHVVAQVRASGGMPAAQSNLIVLRWNDKDALARTMAEYGTSVAAVIMEPVPQIGAFLPRPGYLEAVRDLTAKFGAAFILDEVVTGFRLGLGGAQAALSACADLVVLGKALGAGFPVSAVVGSRRWLDAYDRGAAVHMGTFNGHAVSLAAALAALKEYVAPAFHERLNRNAMQLADGLRDAAGRAGAKLVVRQAGGLIYLTMMTGDGDPHSYGDLAAADTHANARLAQLLLSNGVMIQSRGVLMLSAAHTSDAIECTLAMAHRAFHAL